MRSLLVSKGFLGCRRDKSCGGSEIPLAATTEGGWFVGRPQHSVSGVELTDIPMHPVIIEDRRARAMAVINAWLQRDQEGFDIAAGDDEEAAEILPVVIGELCTAIERLTSPGDLRQQVNAWLNEHAARLAG
jgi:hypothetical protein